MEKGCTLTLDDLTWRNDSYPEFWEILNSLKTNLHEFYKKCENKYYTKALKSGELKMFSEAYCYLLLIHDRDARDLPHNQFWKLYEKRRDAPIEYRLMLLNNIKRRTICMTDEKLPDTHTESFLYFLRMLNILLEKKQADLEHLIINKEFNNGMEILLQTCDYIIRKGNTLYLKGRLEPVWIQLTKIREKEIRKDIYIQYI